MGKLSNALNVLGKRKPSEPKADILQLDVDAMARRLDSLEARIPTIRLNNKVDVESLENRMDDRTNKLTEALLDAGLIERSGDDLIPTKWILDVESRAVTDPIIDAATHQVWDREVRDQLIEDNQRLQAKLDDADSRIVELEGYRQGAYKGASELAEKEHELQGVQSDNLYLRGQLDEAYATIERYRHLARKYLLDIDIRGES